MVSAWVKKKFKYSSEAVRNDPNHFVNMVPGYNEDIDFIQNHTFSEWILEKFDGNKPRTINLKYVKGTDRYLRFESLQNDFSSMLNELGIENEFVIPVANVTKNKENDYRQYYSNHARKTIAKVFKEELEYFKYSF